MKWYLPATAESSPAFDPYWDITGGASVDQASTAKGAALETVKITPANPTGVGLKKTLIRQYVSGGFFAANGTLTQGSLSAGVYHLGDLSLRIKASTDVPNNTMGIYHWLVLRVAIVSSDLGTIRRRCLVSTGFRIPAQSECASPSWCVPISKFFHGIGHSEDFVACTGDRWSFEIGVMVQQYLSGSFSTYTTTLVFGAPYATDANLANSTRLGTGNYNPYVALASTTAPVLGGNVGFIEARYARPFAATHRPDRIQYPSVAPTGQPLNTRGFNS